MKIGPIAHGALLVAALGFAYQTWTREKSEDPKAGNVTVWNEAVSDFEAFAYDGDDKSIRVERRKDGSESYLWGQVTRQEKKRLPRVPVKGESDVPAEQLDDDAHGHGGPGPKAPLMPKLREPPGGAKTPGAGPGAKTPGPGAAKTPGPGAARTPAAGAKEPAKTPAKTPAKSGTTGSGTGPKAPSPHHSLLDQPGQPEASQPATKPPVKPAAPAKPAGATKPAGGKAPPAAGATKAGAAAGAKPPVSTPADKPPAAGSTSEPTGDDTSTDDLPEDPGAAGGTDDPASATPPEPDTETITKQFPVGKAGEELIASLAHLRALRDLGKLTDKQKDEYGLVDTKENLTVFFNGGKQRTLLIGSRVFGGGDRYVMESDSGKGYVLSNSEIMRHIDGGENELGLKVLHRFQEAIDDDQAVPLDPKAPKPKRDKYPGVGVIELETPTGNKTLVRDEHPDPESGGTVIGWADKAKPGATDMMFANFLTQIERLKPTDYDPEMQETGLTKVLTLRYKKAGGENLGTFELFKKEPTVTPELEPSEESKKQNEEEYWARSELTRVLGKVGRMTAERVTEDLPQIFGQPRKPSKASKDGKTGWGRALENTTIPAPGAPADKPGGAGGATPAKPGKSEGATPKPAPAKPAPAKAAEPAKPAGAKPAPAGGNK